jgi:hypothetical protein
MKKFGMLLGTLLLALASSVQAAPQGGGTYCIAFANFCDGLEVGFSGPTGQLSGLWKNTDCVGTDVPVTGRIVQGVVSLICNDFATCPVGFMWLFTVTLSTQSFNLIGWDGVSPFPQQLNQPVRLSNGACSFSEGTGIPSSLR